jgi:hypothetical protein
LNNILSLPLLIIAFNNYKLGKNTRNFSINTILLNLRENLKASSL